MPVLYKSVIQRYKPTPEVSAIFPTFVSMVNDCLRTGLQSRDYSYTGLKAACHDTLASYDVEHSYRLGALFEASNLLKKYGTESRRRSIAPPYCRRPYVAVSLGVYLDHGSAVLPGGTRIPLNPHTQSVMGAKGVRVISATLTPMTCSLIYYRAVKEVAPRGLIAVDVNESNVTAVDTKGQSLVFDLSMLRVIHETIRRTKSRYRRQDVRVKQRIFRKYADIEHNRKVAILHNVSSALVGYANKNRLAIVLEELGGLREIFRRSTSSSGYYLSYMNAWPYHQLQRQIYYKARWNGLRVHHIDPEWTSEKCSECGGSMEKPPVEDDILVCLSCGLVIDRDLNGAKNILKRALRAGAVGFEHEAMKEKTSNEAEYPSRFEPSSGLPAQGRLRA